MSKRNPNKAKLRVTKVDKEGNMREMERVPPKRTQARGKGRNK